MSLRHAILGLLARQPSTGYDLARLFDLSLRTTWHASHSQIYPELARLEEAGMVEVVGHGPRRKTTRLSKNRLIKCPWKNPRR